MFDHDENDQAGGSTRRKRSIRRGVREDHAMPGDERDGRYG
jgi:hypothetical protein